MFGKKKQPDLTVRFVTSEDYDRAPRPAPANRFFPQWYKTANRDVPKDKNHPGHMPTGTMRRCASISDAMGMGYIVPFPVEVVVQVTDDGKVFPTWRGPIRGMTEHHGEAQLIGPYAGQGNIVMKWNSIWNIYTAPGVSCLFTHPMYRDDLPFRTFEGIIDTDKYPNTTNFPALWLKKEPGDYIIERGSPMVQVIPFVRAEWNHTIESIPKSELQLATERDNLEVITQRDGYKKVARQPKRWL